MAVNLDFDKLSDIARGRDWPNFWTEYQRQWHTRGGDPNVPIDKVRNDAHSSYEGYIYKPSVPKDTSSGSSGGTGYGPGEGSGSFFQKLIKTQTREKMGDQGESDTLGKSFGVFFNSEGKWRGIKGMIKEMGNLLENEILIYLDEQSKLLTKINEETGMTGQLSKAFRDEIMQASPAVIRLGISFEELSQAVSDTVSQSGKFKLLSSDTIKEMALASKFSKDMTEFASMGKNFETIGIGIKNMSTIIEKMGKSSLEIGINSRTTTKLVDENLFQINAYGFKNGIAGLNEMAQKSLEFRMNMNQAFALADKVWSPEGALEVVSNLQVIGGAFGDLNDPIKLMYMATNNVEGLQDALIGASKSLVTFNQEQGKFEITGGNLRRAHEMAQTLGVDYKELTNGAIAAAERTSATADLMASGLKMDDKDREFLTNLSQMVDGKMTIEVPKSLQASLGKQTEIALDSMTSEQAKLLLDQREAFKKMSMEDIARQQVTAVENIERDVSFLRAVARVGVGQGVGDAIDKMIGANQKNISDTSKNITDKIGGMMGEGLGALKDKTQDLMKRSGLQMGNVEAETASPNMATNQKKSEAAAETTNTPNFVEKRVLDININPGNGVVDEFSRAIWRDSRFLNVVTGSYLNPN